jgi:signal transduction histidine kinase
MDVQGIVPHGYCLLWQQPLVALHVISDAVIAIAYIMIPAIIYFFVRKKNIVRHQLLFRLFATFILACAFTHLMGIVVIWQPYYYLQGLTMAFTALVSMLTVAVLWRKMPELIKMPSLEMLQRVNELLVKEIERRKKADASLHQLNITLENRVAEEVSNNRAKDLLMIQQSRLAAMGEMIGNIAHQWRQPINALNLVLTNIDDAYRHNELTEAFLAKQIKKGEHLVETMSGTIDDFRNFFKSEHRMESFELNQAVDKVINIVEAGCNSHHISLEVHCDRPISIVGLPGQYRQALLNIIGNAKDALVERKVEQGKITVSIVEDNEQALVTIGDNAGGISPDIIDKIFDPYFTTRAQGNGIGLYMTKMIIENDMHGKLTVRNIDGGVEFVINTPLMAGKRHSEL